MESISTTTDTREGRGENDFSADGIGQITISTLMEHLAAIAHREQPAEGPVDPADVSVAAASASLLGAQDELNDIADNLEDVVAGLNDLHQVARGTSATIPTQEASRRFAAAQAAAEEARAAYQQAQARVANARREWESARQATADTAGQVSPAP